MGWFNVKFNGVFMVNLIILIGVVNEFIVYMFCVFFFFDRRAGVVFVFIVFVLFNVGVIMFFGVILSVFVWYEYFCVYFFS